MNTTKAHYPATPASPNFPALEEEVLTYWKEKKVFEESVRVRPAKKHGANNEYVFYDGPPFANGLPHHGHLLTGFVKDAFARYHTMKGERTERRFGWDCHGLPAEMGAEKELNISGRRNIMDFGIGNFNDHCRRSVMQYADQWEWYVNRQARWVDFANDYKTMDTPFMESTIWAFSELYKKGYIYEGFKVMPYSWAAETVLSTSEIRLDDATREKEDKAVTVAFKLKDKPEGAPDADNYYVLAWTTTPWTLPSNLALAVSTQTEYCAIVTPAKAGVHSSDCFILASAGVNSYAKDLGLLDAEGKLDSGPRRSDMKGAALLGAKYEPLFPYFAHTPNAFRILDGSDFIEEGSGTGVVHMAPGFGEDDQRICAAAGIETIVPVNGEGRYTDAIYDLPAVQICHPADGEAVAQDLKDSVQSLRDSQNDETIIETRRCRMRPATADDKHLIEQINNNPQVAETTYNGHQSPEQLQTYLDEILETQAKHGVSQWLVFDKETDALIGRAGLVYRKYPEIDWHFELSRALLPDYWNKGYGDELARAWIHIAFSKLDIDALYVGSMANNPKARHTQEKLGFTYVQRMNVNAYETHDELGYFYQMTRADYERHYPPLRLRWLNVIKETKLADANDSYKSEQLEKFGLANLRIIDWLKARGRLIKQEQIKHNYPHCWRTDQPIIYMAVSSWFVDVPQFRDRMVELNQQINWIPSHIKDGRFGKWLEGAREWSISRSRFWGCPIPVWRSPSGKIKVFGSIAEIEAASGQKVEDLHRPYIDSIVINEGGEEFRRVEDVFDCWFESGSMPYAQVHYPFENKEWFESHFPADFIVEYEAQTRGWFYSMMVLSVALFDRIPFKNCICHGVVLDESGRKLSKKLQNYMDPKLLFDEFGSDALRWFMMASPIMRGSELLLDAKGQFIHDAIRLYIKPIWNAYHFFTLYANADGVKATSLLRHPEAGNASEGSQADSSPNSASLAQNDALNLMDRYILAKCRAMVEKAGDALDAYDTPNATQAISDFVEVLNNWYIRRNKDRFWSADRDNADKQAAYDTLYTVLDIVCRTAAPLLPMISESIYRGLTGEQSVHLADWPDVSAISAEEDLVADMDTVRDVCNSLLSIRSSENIRTRQPLKRAAIAAANSETLKEFYVRLILDEINIKELHILENINTYAEQQLTINFSVAGKRLGAKMKEVGAAAKVGDWKQVGDKIIVAGEVLNDDEYVLKIGSMSVSPFGSDHVGKRYAFSVLSSHDGIVFLDLEITPELKDEGTARDVVRAIQQARKEADLNVADRIELHIEAGESVKAAVKANRDYVAEQTLASRLEFGAASHAQHTHSVQIEGEQVALYFSVSRKEAA